MKILKQERLEIDLCALQWLNLFWKRLLQISLQPWICQMWDSILPICCYSMKGWFIVSHFYPQFSTQPSTQHSPKIYKKGIHSPFTFYQYFMKIGGRCWRNYLKSQARPKSDILTCPCSSRRMLAGFRSR